MAWKNGWATMCKPNHVRGRGEDSQAAEAARLVARDAGLEAVDARGASVAELDLLLRRDGHVEQQLRGDDQHVRRHRVPRHARLGLLDALVEPEAPNSSSKEKR